MIYLKKKVLQNSLRIEVAINGFDYKRKKGCTRQVCFMNSVELSTRLYGQVVLQSELLLFERLFFILVC